MRPPSLCLSHNGLACEESGKPGADPGAEDIFEMMEEWSRVGEDSALFHLCAAQSFVTSIHFCNVGLSVWRAGNSWIMPFADHVALFIMMTSLFFFFFYFFAKMEYFQP